jgi:hypothetical protein
MQEFDIQRFGIKKQNKVEDQEKKGYQTRTNFVKDYKDNLLADYYSILNR